jgi:hypothetical protein
LNYELDTYLDALQQFPNNADYLELSRGRAQLIKKDIFKSLMWYVLPDSNKQYPVPIERVKEIRLLNAKGQRPDELGAVELQPAKAEEKEMAHVELVGQISLKTLERNSRRRRDKEQGQQRNQQQGGRPQQGKQQPGGKDQRPPQQGKQQQQGRPQQRGPQQEGRGPKQGGNEQRPPQQQRPPRPPRPQQQRPPQENRPRLDINKNKPPEQEG